MEKIRIRIVHNMARSGSTLICKCVGCMDKVLLLSEIHPRAWRMFNPLRQAKEWFGILTQQDIDTFYRHSDCTFPYAIQLLSERCREKNRILVLRDWAHLDYTGIPYDSVPTYSPGIFDALKDTFEILRICTTRHPVTQWKSLSRYNYIAQAIEEKTFDLHRYLHGYMHYARLCSQVGFIRYENFCMDPKKEMHHLCRQLELPYDDNFATKWRDYSTISGDTENSRPENKIELSQPSPINERTRQEFLSSADYFQICSTLGYDPHEYLEGSSHKLLKSG